MNKIEALKICATEVRELLEASGLKNGLGADKKNAVLFYPSRQRKTPVKYLDSFLTYQIYYADEISRADKLPFAQLVAVSLDYFTKLEELDPSTLEVLGKIENEAEKRGYRLEMKETSSFNESSDFNHLSFDIKKLFI